MARTGAGKVAGPSSARRREGGPKTTLAASSAKAASIVAAAPKLSKDELRIQLEKLERANTSLRARSREMNKAAKAAALRIADLEAQLADLQGRAASRGASTNRVAKRSGAPAGARKPRELDPGDAVPPGVAVLEPAPLDDVLHLDRW